MGKDILKTKQIEVTPYSVDVTFIYSNSYDAIYKFAEKDKASEKDLIEIEANDYEGLHLPLSEGGYYLIIKKHKDKYVEIDTITHEISHLVADILGDVGIKFNRKSNEAYAYLIGQINREFFKFKDGK